MLPRARCCQGHSVAGKALLSRVTVSGRTLVLAYCQGRVVIFCSHGVLKAHCCREYCCLELLLLRACCFRVHAAVGVMPRGCVSNFGRPHSVIEGTVLPRIRCGRKHAAATSMLAEGMTVLAYYQELARFAVVVFMPCCGSTLLSGVRCCGSTLLLRACRCRKHSTVVHE